MKKALTNKYTESVTVIERANRSIDFYDVETRRHYTRRVWYSVHSSDIYVQHRGGFYSIATEFQGKYDPQAISRYEIATPEDLAAMTAEIIVHRAGKQYAEDLTWEECTRVYAYAIICKNADANATMSAVVSGILQDRSSQPETRANIEHTNKIKDATRYEVRQVDALMQDDCSWYYNETWHMGEFTTVGDPARAFRRALAKLGITFYRGRTSTEYDGDVYEIVDRKTGEPLFCAIPEEV